ncbi:MAG TPA: SDR family oxidoreductase, partial [Thermoanaerobaculia bacterium]
QRTALITGASSGIGLELARLFAADKWDLALVARNEGKLKVLASELQSAHGITAHVVTADLAKAGAADEVMERLKGVEIEALVNNAGFGTAGEFVKADLHAQLEMIQVNVVALTHLTRLALPAMIARRRGAILNVASTAAFQPGPLMAVYYATKAYVLSFSEAIAEELRDSGVTVTALCPGPTATGFASAAKMESSALFTMTRPAESKDVARAGYEGMKSGKRIVIPGMRNKLMAQSIRISPRRLVTAIVRKMNG